MTLLWSDWLRLQITRGRITLGEGADLLLLELLYRRAGIYAPPPPL